ncbi:MAG: hypothetical protein Q9192_007407, partial [Flavoplaca navasiana]
PNYIQLESQHSQERILPVDEGHHIRPSKPGKNFLQAVTYHPVAECLMHAAPIAMTVWFLASSGRGVYWKDDGVGDVNATLKALQFLAKFHEILMGASLGKIALERIHYGLCSFNGLPLGLATAGYQISSVPYFMSSEFWQSLHAVRLLSDTRAIISRASLLGLIFVTFLLTLVMGPSSAVVIIPSLDWWDHTDPYPEGSERAFMRYKRSDLWPTSITKDLIPPGCADIESPDAEYCPYSGYEMVSEWVGTHQNQGQAPNITIAGHGGVTRHLASVPTDIGKKNLGQTTTSTIGYKEAWDLGAFWQYADGQSRSLAQPSRPRIAPSFLDGTKIFKPVVRIECVAHYTWSIQDLELPRQWLTGYVDPWMIQPSTLRSQPQFGGLFPNTTEGNQSRLGQIPTAFTWIDTSDMNGGPSIGAVFAVNTPNGSVALVPCSVGAYWKETSIFLDPKSDKMIHEEASDPPESPMLWTDIRITPDWADAMNRNLTDDNGLETTYVQDMVERYNNNSSSPVIFSEPGYGQ